jgi:hypothetical protein
MELVLGLAALVALALASWEFGVDSREPVEKRLPIKARPRRSI